MSRLKQSQDWYDTCRILEEKLDHQIEQSSDPRIAQRYSYVCEHGWPSAYLARGTIEEHDSGDPSAWPEVMQQITWCYAYNWPLTADDWVFRPWALMLDASIAMVLVVSMGCLTQWRVQKRGGLLKFNLVDLLVGLTILGVGLGYYTYHRRISAHEYIPVSINPSSAPAWLFDGYGDGTLRPLPGYVGPVWLWKLFGSGTYLGDFYHNTSVLIWPDENWQEFYDLLPTFPYLTNITIRKGLPLDAVDQLRKCDQLETLVLPRFKPGGPTVVEGTSDPLFQVEHLPRLRDLGLKTILLPGTLINVQHIESVAEFPGLEKIQLLGTSITEDQAMDLDERFPDIEIAIVEYY